MRIALISDAWHPQINGVVRTLTRLTEELGRQGHDIRVFSPDQYRSLPCPGYSEIRLSILPGRHLAQQLDHFRPEAIHVATEGPLGWAGRNYCVDRGLRFSTSFHTRFPEYIQARTGLPPDLGYAVLRWFHSASSSVMVATETLRKDLERRGFKNLSPWSRGVDTELFRPQPKDFLSLPRPIFVYVGRVAVEKNIRAFLDLDLAGSKLVVGDGPQLAQFKRRYPGVHFAGARIGEDLARHYAAGDVFVFPSRTDTFGLVQLEALASGLPVAAYPVPGPIDVVNGYGVGCLDEDLGHAARSALAIPAARCRAFALRFSWDNCVRQFLDNLRPIH